MSMRAAESVLWSKLWQVARQPIPTNPSTQHLVKGRMRSLTALEVSHVQYDSSYDVASASDFGNEKYLLTRSGGICTLCKVHGSSFTVATSWPSDSKTVNASFVFGTLVVVEASGEIWSVAPQGPEFVASSVGELDGGAVAAQWSPDAEQLVVVTGTGLVLMLTQTYDVSSEFSLHQLNSFGVDAPVSVGWGHASTQFHGSLGKEEQMKHRYRKDTPLYSEAGETDEGSANVAWRDDGAFFCVSWMPTPGQRAIRFFYRSGQLSSTSEPVDGIEHALAWNAGKSLIACSRKLSSSPKSDVVFLERNGLFRSMMHTQLAHISRVEWNMDGSLLAVLGTDQGNAPDTLLLYHRNNYHWYLKYTISQGCAIKGFSWDLEMPLVLTVNFEMWTSQFSYVWDVWASQSTGSTLETGCVAVNDTPNLLLTPFRLAMTPPPMSLSKVSDLDAVAHCSFSLVEPRFAVLHSSGSVSLYEWKLNVGERAPRSSSPICLWEAPLSLQGASALQCRVLGDSKVAVLGTRRDNSYFVLTVGPDSLSSYEVLSRPLRFVSDSYILNVEGELVPYGSEKELKVIPTGDPAGIRWTLARGDTLITLTEYGALDVWDTADFEAVHKGSYSQATSMALTPEFLLFTTSSNELVFVSLDSCDMEKRSVERGSKIVTTVPSESAVVLQMPRGNLETIYPRPLILCKIHSVLKELEFGSAWILCRKHRIDSNLLYTHDPELFTENIQLVVKQLTLDYTQPEHLNLFLTRLTPENRSHICSLVLSTLEKINLDKDVRFREPYLTALVLRGDAARALELVAPLPRRERNDAIEYLTFVSDSHSLFLEAVGLYDFDLAGVLIRFSTKDPREYVPLLNSLRDHDPVVQKYKVDSYLQRNVKALGHLVPTASTNGDHFRMALELIVAQDLYVDGLRLFGGNLAQRRAILIAQGQALKDGREFEKAGLSFELAEDNEHAIQCYERALLWQPIYVMLERAGTAKEKDNVELARSMAERLCQRKRYGDAAALLAQWVNDVSTAVSALCQGAQFFDALALAKNDSSLLENVVLPELAQVLRVYIGQTGEIRKQIEKEVDRLDALEVKKTADSSAFYELDEGDALLPDDVEVDATSDATTAFTRYTKATTSRRSSRSSRSKRKMDTRKVSGRRNTVSEERYLLDSLVKVVSTRLATLRSDAKAALAFAARFAENHDVQRAGSILSRDLWSLEGLVSRELPRVWRSRSGDWVRADSEPSVDPVVAAVLKVYPENFRPVLPTLAPLSWEQPAYFDRDIVGEEDDDGDLFGALQ